MTASAGISRALLATLFLFVVTPTIAQHPVAEAQIYLREAAASYRLGDFEGFTESLETALRLNPASYATRYNLACGYAKTGRNAEALTLLGELTRARIDFGMAQDDDLASLRDSEEFLRLVAELESNTKPISNSSLRVTVEQFGLMPEGIAIDQYTDRLFFGSMRTGDIYVVDTQGVLSRFAAVQHQGKLAALGLTVDASRNLLWAVGASIFEVEGFDAEAAHRSGVFGFDLTTGELKHEYMAEDSVDGLNDVAIAPNGDLYVSGGVLHVIRAGGDEMVPLATTPEVIGSNGVTMSPDGKTLFLSSYPVGIVAVDLSSGALRLLDSPQDKPLYGIDGLYWYQGDLIGVQNGVRPWRLVRMTLNDGASAVTDVRMIEFANDSITPMTGAIVGHEIHYIGRGPAPDPRPGQFPTVLTPVLGKTIIMTAPLD